MLFEYNLRSRIELKFNYFYTTINKIKTFNFLNK